MRIGLLTSLLALLLALGIPGAGFAGPFLGDSDGDGLDDLLDNCKDVSNLNQVDADGDGCGNHCDGDFGQTGGVGGPDFSTFRLCFGTAGGGTGPGLGNADDPKCEESDMDGSGGVGGPDFSLFRAQFGLGVPGPSLSPLRAAAVCSPTF